MLLKPGKILIGSYSTGFGQKLSKPTVTAGTPSGGSVSITLTTIDVNAQNNIIQVATNNTFTTGLQEKNGGSSQVFSLPQGTYYYRAKSRAMSYLDSDYSSIGQFEIQASTGYEVLRTLRINLTSEYGATIAGSPTWNTLKLLNSQAEVDNSYNSGALVTETNQSSNIYLTNPKWVSANNYVFSTDIDNGIYENMITNGIWSPKYSWETDKDSIIRLNALDDSKYYQIYMLCATPDNKTTTATINGQSKTKSTQNNVGTIADRSNEFSASCLMIFNNVQSGSGVVDIVFRDGPINAIVLQESNSQKV